MSVQELFERFRKAPATGQGGRVGAAQAWIGRYWPAALLLLILAAGGAYYYVQRGEAEAQNAPVLVTAEKGDVEEVVSAVGSLQPVQTVDVGAQVTGQLKALYVKVGDEVEKGQLLAEIDSQVAAAKVDADNAQLRNLHAQLADKQAGLALAKAQAQRQNDLYGANATSRDTYEVAQAAFKSASAQIEALNAQITASQSTLKADQAQLGYAHIYAPMPGTVTAIVAKQGQTLNANQTAPTILTISDLSTMTVNTQVSEADVPKLHVGMTVYFTTLGDRRRRYPAKLRQILPSPTTVNNVVLYTALFDIPNPNHALLPQMTAQVFFVLAEAHDVVTLPVSAIKFADGDDAPPRRGRGGAGASADLRRKGTVTVVGADGKQSPRAVVVGIGNRINAEIISGLKAGESVVAGGDGT